MQILLAILFFGLGAVGASFTTVVVERIYSGQSFVKGRSRCNSCRRTLGGFDLVPVFSWLISCGRCRTCKVRVPVRYAATEALTGFLSVYAYVLLGITVSLFLFLAALLVLLFVVLYDLRHTVVPMGSALLLILLAGAYTLSRNPSQAELGATLLAAGCMGLGFFLLFFLSRGRAMGLGDTPIVCALALLVGWPLSLSGLLFSFWSGALVGIIVLALRRGGPKMGIEIPFVPFLAFGYLLAYFSGWNFFLF